MNFTDIFIKRPVLAVVVSLIILLLGMRAGLDLTVREYPELQNAQISIMVVYPGAEPALVEGFVTTPLEREIASADGIDFLTSSSVQGSARITANLRLDKDPNEALTEISAKISKLRNQLPEGSEDPIIQLAEGSGTDAMYLAFSSDVLTDSQITDYISRVIEPELSAIAGIEKVNVMGAKNYAMRVWLNPEKLVAFNFSASEVVAEIRKQNVLSAVGQTNGNYVKVGLSAGTDLHQVEEFRKMVLRSDDNTLVRLEDVANVVLGADDYDQSAFWDGEPGIFVSMTVRPDANLLDVIAKVHDHLPDIFKALPEGLNGVMAFDSTIYVNSAIKDVRATLVEAVLIVVVVIFLFLGSMRSSLIPAVTVPLSLVGALFLMFLMGFSINLLTLLAMVLAIGMVVDDAIIVLENIHRHIEEGLEPRKASIIGARELVGPVISMTITLVAVYAPIGFLTGITGKLFTEFAFTLAGAVLISGVIALTLTPMMCAKLLKPSHSGAESGSRLVKYLDEKFNLWQIAYRARLHSALDQRHVIGIFGLIVLVSCYFLYASSPAELAPAEDFGFAGALNEADGYASKEYLEKYFMENQKIALANEHVGHLFAFSTNNGGGTNSAFFGMIATPWDERDQTMTQIANDVNVKVGASAGVRTAIFQPPALPTPGQGYPVEFVLKSIADPQTMADVGDAVVARAIKSNRFFYVAAELNIDRPETVLDVNREKAALLGVDMSALSADLAAMMAGGEVNKFAYQGRAYKVMVQVERESRLNPAQLAGFYTRTGSGELIPLSTIVTLRDRVVPRFIPHAQQLLSNTIVAVPRPDISQGDALALLETIAKEEMPAGFQIDYAGSSRQFKQEGSALLATFGFALIIIYLVLAAQFESYRDPLIILVTVPMSICGALLTLNIFAMTNGMQLTNFSGMSLNIYTQVGMVTLIGVISKHGILIVDFANRLQEQGMSKREAIEEASSIRLRPILMTTAALVVAMVPLLLATGPGAASRFSLGMVISSGMTIGTLFTLFVVPAMYMYIGRDHQVLGKSNRMIADELHSGV
ncbi:MULTISPECIES: efflux RND transporter permease subunit [Zhongshania]|jgi:multidrug efflux pump|uniref:Multidrug efflux pump n=1 Tax=Zhongshania antarctica TaxID=641702 RepID=A0A840R244_9GAMM|nr:MULTISPECIES: efflux RND transporter permease subunit [Zhongshania]MBB5187125.1 multidrug efflux pump [Zhongshania antarctica]